MSKETGACLCGAVKIRAKALEPRFHVCHCGMCRKWGGAPSFTVIGEQVTFEGEEHIRAYRSSEWAERAFCTKCGTHLYYRLIEPNLIMLSAGVMDGAEQYTLEEEIYIDNKPEGYAFEGTHPRLTEAEVLAKYNGGGA